LFILDSIIFLSKPGLYEPKLGNYLGDFTDEINKSDGTDYIIKFVSGGAKNYAFITKNGIYFFILFLFSEFFKNNCNFFLIF
jgi:hypothetical protein